MFVGSERHVTGLHARAKVDFSCMSAMFVGSDRRVTGLHARAIVDFSCMS